jgi:exodeoxyribonuclease VII small subunit
MNSKTSPQAVPPADALKFEAALEELEAIVQNMEEGKLSLEDALTNYRRGADLLHRCQDLLGDAEQQIQVLEKGVLRDLDPTAGEV